MKNFAKALILVIIMALMCPTGVFAQCISTKKAQLILKELNYFPDSVDGVLGQASMNAIRTFQADYDLNTTGKLDKPTCAALVAEDDRMSKKRLRQKQDLIIKRSQSKLRALGYYQGPLSGKKSDIPPTVITDFQSAHSLKQTRRLDGATLRMLFSDKAHKKPEPKVIAAPKPKAPTPKPKPAPKPRRSVKAKTQKPLWIWSVGSMQYAPKSLYNSTNYEAINETLSPEQAVSYEKASYLMNQLTLNLSDYQFYLATSRLGGGDTSADFLGFNWSFGLFDIPWLLITDYAAIESEAVLDNDITSISTQTLSGELLMRSRPGLLWGLALSHGTYPTLVSAKHEGEQNRSIYFDEDFNLITINAALHYDTEAAGMTGLFGSDTFYPYFTSALYTGLTQGNVSNQAIDSLSTDLDYAFDATIYHLNLRLKPEVGIKYRLKRRSSTIEFTLGYGFDIQWPALKLPQGDDGDEVEFYRRGLSHGLILGVNVVF